MKRFLGFGVLIFAVILFSKYAFADAIFIKPNAITGMIRTCAATLEYCMDATGRISYCGCFTLIDGHGHLSSELTEDQCSDFCKGMGINSELKVNIIQTTYA